MFHTASGKAVYHTVFMGVCSVRPRRRCQLRSKGRGFHDLRRTRATLLIAAGAHAKLGQEGLGHSSITTTINLCEHVCPPLTPPWFDALDVQCDEGDDAAAAQEVERARGLK